MRPRVVRWTVAAVALSAALWVADAAVRSLLFHIGTFPRQLLAPSPETLLARIPLIALGVVILLSMRGIKLLEDARAEAVAERRRLRELYDYTTDAIMLLDRDLRVVFMNKTAERIGGKRFAEAIGWPCHRVILGQEEPCPGCQAARVFETGRPESATKYETTDTGQENWLEQHWYPVFDNRGDVVAAIEVARDISDIKLLEREVAALHKMLDARRRSGS